MEIGQISTITFNDNTTAKIKLVHIDTYSTMPSDYWFDYVDGETNKQFQIITKYIVHRTLYILQK